MAYDPPTSLTDAQTRFEAWSERLLKARTWQSQQPLYHYTSFNTLPKILSTQQLWMTSLFKQKKDPLEFVFGLKVLTTIIRENLPDVSPSYMHTCLFNRIRTLAEGEFEKAWGCHIACVAPHGEDLDLWTNFGDRGNGVALKIAADYFAVRSHGDDEPKWAVQPVTYGVDVAAHQLCKVIQAASMALAEAAPFVQTKVEANAVVKQVFELLVASHIIPICMLAKQGNFIAEAEVRIFAPSSLMGNPSPPDKITAPLPHHFIEGIFVGEKADADLARRILADFGLSPSLVQVAAYSRGLQDV